MPHNMQHVVGVRCLHQPESDVRPVVFSLQRLQYALLHALDVECCAADGGLCRVCCNASWGLMNHSYAKLSEQQPMLLPILELESDPTPANSETCFQLLFCCLHIDV
jgi:hypothetical protein